MIGIVVGC